MGDLIRLRPEIPTGAQLLHLHPGHLNRSGIAAIVRDARRREEEGLPPLIAGAASFSDYCEKAVLEHIVNKATMESKKPYLALCTAAPTDASTGASITEATGATGYARLEVPGTKWTYSAPSISNNEVLTFPEITSGSAVVKGWALCDNSGTGAGNVLAWGTATETTISTTATPPTVNSGVLKIELD